MKFFLFRPLVPLWNEIRYHFGLKVASFLIAGALWVVVFGSKTIEITKEVPFEAATGEDQILVDPVPEKISFRLAGPKAFLRSITNRIEDPIRSNLKDVHTGLFTQRIFSDSIKLPLGVKVLSINPNVIQMRIEELKRKPVVVKVSMAGDLPDGLRIARSEILPEMIRVKGPKNRVLMLSSLATVPVDLGSIRETTVVPLAFDFKSIGIEPDSVLPELNVEVQGKGQIFRIKHVPIIIKATGKAVSDDQEVTVMVRTDTMDAVKIDGDEVSALLDVRDMPSGEYQKWIRVQLPEKVHLVRVIPPSTRITVKGQ